MVLLRVRSPLFFDPLKILLSSVVYQTNDITLLLPGGKAGAY
jgi:hypothetical protein